MRWLIWGELERLPDDWVVEWLGTGDCGGRKTQVLV
jgi:hypothetical protein